MEIKQGIISDADFTIAYDNDGYEYRQYHITINGKRFNSKTPKGLYLKERMMLWYAVEDNEILSGYCPAEGTQWGPHIAKLKGQSSDEERYSFMRGVVREKRRQTSTNKSYSSTYNETFTTGVGFVVVLANETFHTSYQYGKNLKPGDEVAAVLEKGSAVMLKNLSSSTTIGRPKPIFVFILLLIILLNVSIPYVKEEYPGLLVNPSAVIVVLNMFLGLFFLLQVAVFVKAKQAQRVMERNV